MKKIVLILISAFFLLSPNLASKTQPYKNVVKVKNIIELFNAIGPDRIIVLKKGDYLVYKAKHIRHKYLSWDKHGSQPVINFTNNLVLRGEKGVRILNSPYGGVVLAIKHAQNIVLENLIMGHTGGKNPCWEGVLQLEKVNTIKISRVKLFGSGLWGIKANKVSSLFFVNSIITECTYNIMQLNNCNQLTFKDSVFSKTEFANLFDISKSVNIFFQNCSILQNNGYNIWKLSGNSYNIELVNCTLIKNRAKTFLDYKKIRRLKRGFILSSKDLYSIKFKNFKMKNNKIIKQDISTFNN